MGTGAAKPPKPSYVSKHEVARLLVHTQPINCFAVSADGKILISGSDDCTARIWSTNPVECTGVLGPHDDYVTGVAIVGLYCFTSSADCILRKWSIPSKELLALYEGHTRIVTKILAFDDVVISAAYDTTVCVWDVEPEGRHPLTHVLSGHDRTISSLAYLPGSADTDEDDLIISAGMDGIANCWQLTTGLVISQFTGHNAAILCMAVNSEGTVLATGSSDNTVITWNLQTGETVKTFKGHKGAIVCLLLTSKILYTGSVDKTARSWMLEFGSIVRIYRGQKHTISHILHYKNMLITGCGDGSIFVYDSRNGELIRQLLGHQLGVSAMKMINGRVFTGSVDCSLRCWSLDGLGLADADYDTLSGNPAVRQKMNEFERLSLIKNYIPRNPESGAAQVFVNHNATQIFLDNQHPYINDINDEEDEDETDGEE